MAVKRKRGPVQWDEEPAKVHGKRGDNTLFILEFKGGFCLLLEMGGQGGWEIQAEGSFEECCQAAEDELIWVYEEGTGGT